MTPSTDKKAAGQTMRFMASTTDPITAPNEHPIQSQARVFISSLVLGPLGVAWQISAGAARRVGETFGCSKADRRAA